MGNTGIHFYIVMLYSLAVINFNLFPLDPQAQCCGAVFVLPPRRHRLVQAYRAPHKVGQERKDQRSFRWAFTVLLHIVINLRSMIYFKFY